MKYFDLNSALKTFYYMMSIDGKITSDELSKFDEVGATLAADYFNEHKNTIISECNSKINMSEVDFYDVIQEDIDEAIDESDGFNKIGSRLVIWNLLVIAISDGEYSSEEKKLLRHISRVTGVEADILLEMEQSMNTIIAVQTALENLKNSDRPYSEIGKLVEEYNARRNTVLKSVMELIQDEIIVQDVAPKATVMDKLNDTKNQIAEKTNPLISEMSGETKRAFNNAKNAISEKSAPLLKSVGNGLMKGAGRLINKANSIENKETEGK